jgi:hypothetical protein
MTTAALILRWICVLPGALLAAFLVAFPVHWVVMLIQLRHRFFGTPDDSFISTTDGRSGLAAIPPEVLERLGMAFFAPFALVAVGALIAPRYRFRTAVALTVIFVIGLSLAYIYVASSPKLYFTHGWFQRALTYVLWVAGVGCGLYVSRSERASTTTE